MTDSARELPASPRRARIGAALTGLRRAATSLPGKLLGLAVAFVMLAEVLIFLPSAAAFRNEWLRDRAEAAHLAALAAEAAPGAMPSEEAVRELLAGADVVAVGRVYDGVNELVLGGRVSGELVKADLTDTSLLESMIAACDTLFAPPGRYINIWAEPQTRPNERMSVIVREDPLRDALIDFSIRIFWLSIFISLVTGGLIYLSLLFILVRPMRRLARAMTAFQEDPSDLTRMVEPSRRADEIGEAERALAAMQADVRAAFRSKERLATLGSAVAKINHDLRNVLSSAQLISDRLAMSSDERVAAMGSRLVRAIDRGVRLCAETLEYGRSREHDPHFETVILRDALDDAAGDAFASVGAAEWINAVEEDLTVRADPDHLHRIFLNLFRNAVQAMETSQTRSLSVGAAIEEERVRVRVADTGPGIPERVQKTLFAPFAVTGNRNGTGLGLSIAKELAHTLGGEVRLVETGEGGTVFEVVLKAG